MKKQIFKLTSILLAMVMVFTLFTIIPISAEEQPVSLFDAAARFKTAWEDLAYKGESGTESVPINFFGNWQQQGDSVNDPDVFGETSWKLPLTTTTSNMIFTAETKTALGTKATTYDIKDIDELYFYYKSNTDFNFGLSIVYGKSGKASEYETKKYSDNDTMKTSNGEWVKFDIIQYTKNRNAASSANYPVFSDLANTFPYLFRVNFNNLSVTAAEGADVSFSQLFVGLDKNLEGTDEYTPVEWFDKADALDLEALKADYDTTDETNWEAFRAAREALLACSPEAAVERLRAAAAKLGTYGDTVMTPTKTYITGPGRVPTGMTDSVTANYGSKTATLNLPTVDASSFSGKTTDGLWFDVDDGNPSSDNGFQIGKGVTNEAYLTFYVNSIEGGAASTNIRFRVRGGTTSSKCDFNEASTTVLTVKADEEYTLSLSEMLKGSGADVWQTYFTTMYFNFLCMTAMDTSANITVGSVVLRTNYAPSSSTGAEFVEEMVNLKSRDDEYASYTNTEEFEAALSKALAFYPDVAKDYAVKNFVSAWKSLTPTAYGQAPLSIVSGNIWITDDNNYQVEEDPGVPGVSAPSFKVTALANPKGETAEGEASPDASIYNEISWTNEPGKGTASAYLTDIKKADIEDLYFYYKSDVSIYANPGLVYTNGRQYSADLGTPESNRFGNGYVLPVSDGKWVKVSFKDFVCDPMANGTANESYWTARYASRVGYEYLLRVSLRISAASESNAEVLFSNIFVDYGDDPYLEGTEGYTADQWIEKAADLDLEALKADYNRSSDTDWQAFEAAYQGLKIHINAFRANAVIESANGNYINADAYSPEVVLAEARGINTSTWQKNDADTFKKAVKALETAVGEEGTAYIAGNWYEDGLTIKDLSVLSRYVDAEVKKTFLEANFIDLDCADINEDGEINNTDVERLRQSLLRVPTE